jgi:hypothetical protein
MKMLLISQVAVLAKEIEKDSAAMDTTIFGRLRHLVGRENLRGIVFIEDDTDDATPSKPSLHG